MVDVTPLSEKKRTLLERYYRGSAVSGTSVAAIAPRPTGTVPPVSLSQEQLLLRERHLQGNPPLYNECIRLRMNGPLKVLVLEECLHEIIQRHEIWRTSYKISDGRFLQTIHARPDKIELPVIDLRDLPQVQAHAEIQRVAGEAVRQPFDLKEGPLLRARIFRTADMEHLLYLSAHLSIVDGVSVYQVFPFELAALYRAYACGKPSPLPDLTVQFGDYSHWQRQWMQGGEAARQVAYWRKQLAGPIPVLTWPADWPRRVQEKFDGVIRSFSLRRECVDALAAVARQQGATLFMGLLAGLVSLLYLYTQQDDIIVGTPSPAGRKRSEVQKLLGYFLNPVGLRFDLTGDPTFRTVLQQAQRVTLEAISNDDVPLELVAHELGGNVNCGRNPFFTVAMSLQPSTPQLDLDWSVTSMDLGSGGSPWDLYLAFINRPAETMVRVQFDPGLFDEAAITRMIGDYETLLGVVSGNPAARISQLDLAKTARACVAGSPSLSSRSELV